MVNYAYHKLYWGTGGGQFLLGGAPLPPFEPPLVQCNLINNKNNNSRCMTVCLDCPGESTRKKIIHSHLSSSSTILYQLPPSTTIHSLLPVQFTCLTVFLHNLSPSPRWCTSWSGTLHLLHTFLRPISVFFSVQNNSHYSQYSCYISLQSQQ